MVKSKESISEKVLHALETNNWPMTTEQVAKKSGISWQTAQVALFKLLVEKKVVFQKSGKQNQWKLKKM